MRAKRVTAALSLAILAGAGCTGPGQPSPPPEPVESLGESSATSEPPPPDTETKTATATSSPTTKAGGAPELPPEATEQTEAGAEAFVAHYFDLLNYGTMTPDAGALANTGTPQCQTCVAFEESLQSLAEDGLRSDGPSIELLSATASEVDGEVLVETILSQINPAVLTLDGDIENPADQPSDVSFALRLTWTEAGWRIVEIE
ncbi:MAG: DUF6318 family protein [Ornithinimicrobium sp.]|uniref:DUF6318 family protein n=1 Tax=Ornithinimicrobium sp. TaxID=1977084 RepID=UPI003D9ABAFC